MLITILKKIDSNRISMDFNNEKISFDFFNLISEKGYPVLTNKNQDIKFLFCKEEFVTHLQKCKFLKIKSIIKRLILL